MTNREAARELARIHQMVYTLWLWDRQFDRDVRDVLMRGAQRPNPFGRFFWCLT